MIQEVLELQLHGLMRHEPMTLIIAPGPAAAMPGVKVK